MTAFCCGMNEVIICPNEAILHCFSVFFRKIPLILCVKRENLCQFWAWTLIFCVVF